MAHRLRSKVKAAEAGAELAPVSLVERRDPHAGPAETAAERRRAAQRRSERHQGVVERAAIQFRGKPALVQVVNASEGGITIETALRPEPGETLGVALEGQPPRTGIVRWVRGGQVGIAFG
ncbi:MAG TPA: PilZ domain-containing protein [Allosphingosinicella sp.]|nr:PilZ domain-containing protein [Allosphingosinicella sp.]